VPISRIKRYVIAGWLSPVHKKVTELKNYALLCQVIDFPLHFPAGTTTPGGIMVPVGLRDKASEGQFVERF